MFHERNKLNLKSFVLLGNLKHWNWGTCLFHSECLCICTMFWAYPSWTENEQANLEVAKFEIFDLHLKLDAKFVWGRIKCQKQQEWVIYYSLELLIFWSHFWLGVHNSKATWFKIRLPLLIRYFSSWLLLLINVGHDGVQDWCIFSRNFLLVVLSFLAIFA